MSCWLLPALPQHTFQPCPNSSGVCVPVLPSPSRVTLGQSADQFTMAKTSTKAAKAETKAKQAAVKKETKKKVPGRAATGCCWAAAAAAAVTNSRLRALVS